MIKKHLIWLFIGVGIFFSQNLFGEEAPEFVTLSIMKFNTISNQGNNFLGESFSETLSTKISGLSGVKLYERSQFEKITRELKMGLESGDLFNQETVQHIGKIISIDYMALGSVTQMDKEIRIGVRLVNVKTSRAVLSTELSGKYPDEVFDLQDQLAMLVVKSLSINMSELEKKSIYKKPTESLDAFALYNKSLENKDLNTKIKLLNRALQEDREFIQALHLLAESYYQSNLYEKSINTYNRILSIEPDNFKGKYNMALLLFDKGDLKKAEEQLLSTAKVKPKDPNIWYHLALIKEYNDQGIRQGPGADLNKAWHLYKKAFELNQNHLEASYALGILSAVFAGSGSSLIEQKKYLEEAVFYLDNYLAIVFKKKILG